MPPKRPLPLAASTALEIIISRGSFTIRPNDFELLMHQRGYDAREARKALKAFERRGWLIVADGVLTLSDAALGAQVARLSSSKAPSRRKHARLPRGLFS